MKPYEVGMFKKFLHQEAAERIFMYLYKNHHWKSNPESIEEYLYKANVNDVCMKAFSFLLNNRFGYDFWEAIQARWSMFYDKEYDHEHAIDWRRLRGDNRRYICQNWDVKEYWNFQNKTDTLIRIEALIVKCGIKEETGEALLEQLGLIETEDVTRRNSVKLKRGQISINSGNGTHKITFNGEDTKFFVENGDHDFCKLMLNAKNEVFLVFNHTEGINVSRTKKGCDEVANIVVCSKAMVEKVKSIMAITKPYVIANIKVVANTAQYLIYQVTL